MSTVAGKRFKKGLVEEPEKSAKDPSPKMGRTGTGPPSLATKVASPIERPVSAKASAVSGSWKPKRQEAESKTGKDSNSTKSPGLESQMNPEPEANAGQPTNRKSNRNVKAGMTAKPKKKASAQKSTASRKKSRALKKKSSRHKMGSSSPMSSAPTAGVMEQLKGIMGKVNEMKEQSVEPSAPPSAPEQATRPKVSQVESEQPKQAGPDKTARPGQMDEAQQAEMAKLVHFCNSMNLYQKAHILSFLAREIVLQDPANKAVMPLTNCDIVIDGVTIVAKLPGAKAG